MNMENYKRDVSVKDLLEQLGITELLKKDGLTELMINRPNEVFIEGTFGVERIESDILTYRNLERLANVTCIFNNKNITPNDPMQSARLPTGERVHIIIPPACEDGTIVFSIRKPSNNRFSLNDFIETGRLNNIKHSDSKDKEKLKDFQVEMLAAKKNKDWNSFFEIAVLNSLNICMVGGTSSGKTTFTKAIADLVPKDQRLVTIEDTHELDLPNHSNRIHLFYDNLSKKRTSKDVLASCMRIKPDRIFLTELRGDETWDYLSALNTGHGGGLTSVHANDAKSAPYRIAQLAKESETGKTMDFEYILKTVQSTIDVICFFKHTHMTEIYFDPEFKNRLING